MLIVELLLFFHLVEYLSFTYNFIKLNNIESNNIYMEEKQKEKIK
jgi:hypothetical protein